MVVVSGSEAFPALRVMNMHGAYAITMPYKVAWLFVQESRVFGVFSSHSFSISRFPLWYRAA